MTRGTIEYRYKAKDGQIVVWLGSRPTHCDRGRWHAVRDAPMRVSSADLWPRYYFDLERGMLELMEYVRIKQKSGATFGLDYSNGHWDRVEYDWQGNEEKVTLVGGPVWTGTDIEVTGQIGEPLEVCSPSPSAT